MEQQNSPDRKDRWLNKKAFEPSATKQYLRKGSLSNAKYRKYYKQTFTDETFYDIKCTSGYYRMALTEKDQERTAFTWNRKGY